MKNRISQDISVHAAKPHYILLDGLRGVAALMVIIYHCFECFPMDSWIIGHGYLAVDFFFILSGFVIGYAYDDRWKKSGGGNCLTVWQFFKRRLIRLHPMVVFGVIVGAVAFFIQGGIRWDGSHVAVSAVMVAMLLHLFMIPETSGSYGEIRGNGEMFPLNGPHWSLFFEYIGNILYASILRRLSTKWLKILTAFSGVTFAVFAISDVAGYGNIGVGWTLDGANFWGGLLRMLFPFAMGLTLSRIHKPIKIRGAFWKSSLAVIILLSLPNFGTGTLAWRNCLYEIVCIALFFPAIVYAAASGTVGGKVSGRVCTFIGNISYPLYAVHYPSMYLFYAYIGFPETWRTPAETWPWMILLVAGNILLAYLAWRFYDVPVRKWLSKNR